MLKTTGYLCIATLLTACAGQPPEPAATPADAVATWDGGALVLADLESAFAGARTRACRQARRGGGLDELVPCYRELAEGQALEHLVLAEVEDVDAALEGLEGYEELRRHAYREVFMRRLREELEIEDAEIEARFAADPERYRRPGGVNLSNLFRRHEDPARPEQTIELLAGLKQRFESGETFDALAREYSHSETRLRGGQVGRVAEGELPKRLEEAAFALGEGEVSDPIRVRGGAVLLYVQAVTPGVEPTLAEARGRIQLELRAERLEQAVSDRVAGKQPPEGSLVLDLEELTSALDAGDEERAVLEIGGERLSAGELRRLARLGTGPAAELDDEARDRLAEVYFRQQEQRLLALELVESVDGELHEEAAEHLRGEAVSQLVDERLQSEMAGQVEGDEETLRGYFEDNRHHYQSPLRFQLKSWDLPFGDDPPAQLAGMEALRERLAAGELDLAAAAEELGGSVRDLGWREFDGLAEDVPGKARTYLMEVGGAGFSVPYQQDEALHVIELVARDEPRQLEYDEAAERVREDYLQRFQQDLFGRVVEERLHAAGFAFDEEAVRRLLAPDPA